MRHSIRSDTPNFDNPRDHVPRAKAEPARVGEPTSEGGEAGIRERAVLAAVLLPASNVDLRAPLAELEALADSAGAEVVAGLVQKRLTLEAATALGKGKVEELAGLVEAYEANLVIFDNELSPRQIRALEERIACRVIDRSELILDIFANRARTREAQLQVELAQLQYTAPRLRGMWTHLERIAGAGGGTAAGVVGGVGARGPGERQIEIDRRLIKDRIARLRREIVHIDERKRREVESRGDQYTVSLVGYTNSGKTTLLNRLARTEQFAADQLFATLDTKTARWDLGEGRTVLLSDTVGFVRNLPHHLIASFRATLEEALHAHLLLHVVDVSSPGALHQVEAVNEVLEALGCGDLPQITLLNKVDVAEDLSYASVLELRSPRALRISALTGEGLDALTEAVARSRAGETVEVEIKLPHTAGKALSDLDRYATVHDRQFDAEGMHLQVCISRSHLHQLQSRYPELRVVRSDPPGADA